MGDVHWVRGRGDCGTAGGAQHAVHEAGEGALLLAPVRLAVLLVGGIGLVRVALARRLRAAVRARRGNGVVHLAGEGEAGALAQTRLGRVLLLLLVVLVVLVVEVLLVQVGGVVGRERVLGRRGALEGLGDALVDGGGVEGLADELLGGAQRVLRACSRGPAALGEREGGVGGLAAHDRGW